jgi:cytochrome c biogenesis protein
MARGQEPSTFLSSIWELFASVKLTVVVLVSLAATSIIGTLIPQNETAEAYLRTYGEFLFRIFYILDIFDMYHSWWFQFLLVLLGANIVVCSAERLSAAWNIIFTKDPVFHLSRFQGLPNREQRTLSSPGKDLKKAYVDYISKHFKRYRVEEDLQGYRIFAEKGRWTRLGAYGVHFSVLVLLFGGLVGSFFGFEGFVNIPEGQTADSIRLRYSGQIKPLGFGIRCDDFEVQFYESGAPKVFRSSLTVVENGKPVLQKDIFVNDPLHHRGINFYQSSYGTIGIREISIRFKSTATGMEYNVAATVGHPVSVPENGGEFLISDFQPAFNFRGQNIGETIFGRLQAGSGPATEVILPLRFPDFDRMRKGDWVISASNPQYAYYTGLQVSKDPSVWIVYTGFIFMILGCVITFFMSHQRICVEVVRSEDLTTVFVSGSADKNRLGMDRKIAHISQKLYALAGPSERK